ncbi:MAG: tetratricopeptide repeat protein [Meiothermus sp.]|uniref:ATP-binding protein n=1 Tax=Meiothermus sp. TaxID=1955249 RepID=UPI0025D9B273|nr:tetratricopeptide repeat protein [Meiothermus sp.]MCS7067992.1 tetratricopeptide repeat protein [Meiothermus sp.]MDW8424371.1 tetratricopeptide repeat protein [Meiothermus sp.]
MQPQGDRAVSWGLVLLESPRLQGPGQAPLRLERKTAALLAYLALEGPTPRSRLAGLLWPNSPESTARNNLSQVLRRLRQAGGEGWVTGSDTLSLQGIATDVTELELAHFAGRHAEVVQGQGQLLEGLDYDDCPELEDWLITRREYLNDLRRRSLTALADAAEQAGEYREALHLARSLLELDLISEAAHRRVMRLLYLLGDRGAALAAYHRCQEILHKELGTQPLPETQALARQIDQGQRLEARAPERNEMPLGLLRPPHAVGRKALLRQMERAWLAGQHLILSGPPGVGKSRLMQEFLGTRGAYLALEGRPSDHGIPYASHSRIYRQLLEHLPALPLPDWVRSELSRIVPELGQAPGPIQSEADRLRFLQAKAELIRLGMAADLGPVALDDLQYFDEASLEAWQFVFAQGYPQSILTYRIGELPPGVQGFLNELLESNQAVLLEVGPLDQAALEELLDSLEIPPAGLSEALFKHTGGNPFLALETLRNLWESGGLQQPHSKGLPSSKKAQTLIQHRLGRLSPIALNLARTAAIAGSNFSPGLAAKVLEVGPMHLTEPWAELEANQVLVGHRFAHDLIYEATLNGIPQAVRTLLHWRTAQFLPPEPAAEHYWTALSAPGGALHDQPLDKALEAFSQAATLHFLRGQQETGRQWFERALQLAPDEASQVRILVQRARMEERHLHYPEAAATLNRAEQLLGEVGPVLQASVWNSRAALQVLGFGDATGAQGAAQTALEVLGDLDSREAQAARADALNYLGEAARMQRDFAQAEAHHRQALEIRRSLEDEARLAGSLQNLASVLIERHQPGAQALLEEALVLWKKLGHASNVVRTLNNMGNLSWRLGQLERAEGYFRQALELAQPSQAGLPTFYLHNNLGAVQFRQGKYQQAKASYQTAQATSEARLNPLMQGMALGNLVEVQLRLGEYDSARHNLNRALQVLADTNNPYYEADLHWYAGELEVLQHRPEQALEPYQMATRAAQAGRYPLREAEAWARLARLQAQPGLAEQALELHQAPTTRAAQLLLEGHLEAALKAIRETDDPYEEARLLLDASRLLERPELLAQALALLQKLRDSDPTD